MVDVAMIIINPVVKYMFFAVDLTFCMFFLIYMHQNMFLKIVFPAPTSSCVGIHLCCSHLSLFYTIDLVLCIGYKGLSSFVTVIQFLSLYVLSRRSTMYFFMATMPI
jgi:hypothetical protein